MREAQPRKRSSKKQRTLLLFTDGGKIASVCFWNRVANHGETIFSLFHRGSEQVSAGKDAVSSCCLSDSVNQRA